MSITVYGCVTWPAGTITFENLEECLVQSACIEWTGTHAGQVALTLSGATYYQGCNDTFYGCVDWTTGKFQVLIPDDCCCEECHTTITAFSNLGGGEVQVTSHNHGANTNDKVYIIDTTNYNGSYTITKLDDDNFKIIHSWEGNDGTGKVIRGLYGSENYCECFPENEAVVYLFAVFEGIYDCETEELSHLNGTYCLELNKVIYGYTPSNEDWWAWECWDSIIGDYIDVIWRPCLRWGGGSYSHLEISDASNKEVYFSGYETECDASGIFTNQYNDVDDCGEDKPIAGPGIGYGGTGIIYNPYG